MNGFISRALVLGLACGLTGLTGCYRYRELVDPCWPERYAYQARASVREAAVAQIENGHKLDQTIWAYHFTVDPKTNAPTEQLTPAGQDHLAYLARRRPAADPQIFLQTSGDDKLDGQRQAAIRDYLSKRLAARGTNFEVAVVDPAEVGIQAVPIMGRSLQRPEVQGSVPKLYNNFQGLLPTTNTTGTAGGGSGGTGGGGGR